MDTAHSNMKIKQFYLFQLHTKWFNNIETMVTYTQSLSIRNALKRDTIFLSIILQMWIYLTFAKNNTMVARFADGSHFKF